MSIKIQVATCTQCNGYYSAAPLEQKHINHPDIIDHFFYHGEPWFTLDQKTFENCKNYEHTEIIVMDLDEHVKQDHLYCHCNKKVLPVKTNYNYEISDYQKAASVIEKIETETEIYFKDLYYTYNNFHGMPMNNHHRSSGTRLR